MSDLRLPESSIKPRAATFAESVTARVAGLRKWPHFTSARQTLRRLLTRLQLFWLVHLASQPHGMSRKTAMIIAPHPDDEVLGCGGLIALKRREQTPVQIVFMTDGSASHGYTGACRTQLAARRRQEALQAAAILGVEAGDVHFLDKGDGTLRMLDDQERRSTIQALEHLLISMRPQELYVPHRHDRTDDHEATYELVMAAVQSSGLPVEVFQYSVWMLWNFLLFRDFDLADLKGARRLRIHAVRSHKKRALQAHRSQCVPRGEDEGPVLESGFVARLCLPNEVYFRMATSAEARERSAGPRAKTCGG